MSEDIKMADIEIIDYAAGSNPKAIRLEQELFKQKLIVKQVCEKNVKLVKQVTELSAALEELIDKASECDSWESFPSQYLDEANKALEENQ